MFTARPRERAFASAFSISSLAPSVVIVGGSAMRNQDVRPVMLASSLGHELTRHRPGRRDATQQSGRHDVRPVLGKLGDDRGIEVQQFGDHIRWTMRQPIRQRDLLEPVRPEDLHVDELRVARVLDVMA
jgi:hypothetical protein